MVTYIKGDIHDVIKGLEDNSIDFIYTDPPFGTTRASWDKPLRWEDLFKEMWRVLKPTGIIVLYAALPFTYELLRYEIPKYNYSWKKNITTNFFHAKKQPLRKMEDIFVYYKKPGTYNPQMVGDTFYKKDVAGTNGMGYCNSGTYGSKHSGKKYTNGEGHTGKYPTTFKEWAIRNDGSGITRTDEQIDYFIKTYSNENDVVLDMTCCNNYVGDRCKELNRQYIGVDVRL